MWNKTVSAFPEETCGWQDEGLSNKNEEDGDDEEPGYKGNGDPVVHGDGVRAGAMDHAAGEGGRT